MGRVRLLEEANPSVEERTLAAGAVGAEVRRFRAALDRAHREIEDLRRSTARDVGEDEAGIFDVQLMILEDPLIVDRTLEAIRAEHKNAEFLFFRHVGEVAAKIEKLPDNYFSERATDLHDVKRRILRHLTGAGAVGSLPSGILFGRELTPSEAVQLDPERVHAFATELGGLTSHASIMARARGIPAVVGAKHLIESVRPGDLVVVDGISGHVVVHPTEKMVTRFRMRRRAFLRLQKRREKLVTEPAQTRDGHRIALSANMELPEERDFVLDRGADGVGLFRTEFFFMVKRRAPTEEEQLSVYRRIMDGFGDLPVIIRVLDVGGDKVASYLGLPRERNPYLGMRGIRYLLAHPDVLTTQLRALLRAAAGRRARILFPMVSSVDEFVEAKRHTRGVIDSLKRRRIPHDSEPELGAMIEVPSAAIQADELAREADFFSIGSNDLIQYLLAIDRDHETLGYLYQPLHPAVLRTVAGVIQAGHRHRREVGVCGEMAGQPMAVPILLGLGVDRLSVSPYMLPEVKQTIRVLRFADCRRVAEEALRCSSARAVADLIQGSLGSRYSTMLKLSQDTGFNGTPRTGIRGRKP